MSATLRITRVTALPAVLSRNTLFLVDTVNPTVFDFYLTSMDGQTVERGFSSLDAQGIIDNLKNAPNGIAGLDNNGLISSAILPSYIDDVLEFSTRSSMPVTGDTGKIYISLDTNKIYRWSGSVYLELSSLSGTSDSAIKLITPRNINGIAFDGTADITINAVDATPRVASSSVGAANGVASLDSNSKILLSSVPTLPKSIVGLSNVDNTSDVNKPVSTAQQSAIDSAQATAIAASTPVTHIGNGGAAHALVISSGAAGFMSGADKAKLDNVVGLNTGDETTASILSKLGITTLSGSNTGDQTSVTGNAGSATKLATARTINNVAFDGTANITINAVDATPRVASSLLGAANGVATLDASGQIPAAQLPSYVDDVLEYTNLAGFPVTGETGKIYVAKDTNKTYRWSGTVYTFITSGAVDSVNGNTGVVVLNKADVGLGNVDNTSDINKPISTAVQTALDAKINSSLIGAPNGIASLNSSSKLIFSMLPVRILVGTVGAFSGTSIIPGDNTTPTTTEGTEIFTKNLTAETATSGLHISGNLTLDCSTGNKNLIIACFKGSVCIGSIIVNFITNGRPQAMAYDFYDPSFGSSGTSTYSLRFGATSAATWYVNRLATQVLNGTMNLNRPVRFEEINV